MSRFIDAELNDAVIKTAGRITLSELLESPVTQCWAISMICNALNSSGKFEEDSEEADELLAFRLFKVNKELKNEDRQNSFHLCGQLIAEQRNERQGDE